MKKLVTIFLLLLYFTFSAGAIVHLHYCMGEYISFSLLDTKEGACNKCGMIETTSNDNCCKDVMVSAKISDSHTIVSLHHSLEMPFHSVTGGLPVLQDEDDKTPFFSSLVQKHPPGGLTLPLFLQYRTIRI